MASRSILCPFAHRQPHWIYLVKVEQRFADPSSLIQSQVHSAHELRFTAEQEAERIAYQHQNFSSAEQTFSWAFPDYQKCWTTTYENGMWKEVRVQRVQFVPKLPEVGHGETIEVEAEAAD